MKTITTIVTSAALGLIFAGPLAAQKAGEALTKEECSACHLVYQGYFLPKRSWQAIMADLPNHFGEDASLPDADRAEIEAFLAAGAADRQGRNPRWLQAISQDVVPMRISELSWFTHEHGNRVKNRVAKDPAIGSISNCAACHKGAERGHYDDD